jgi:hypothetical protein
MGAVGEQDGARSAFPKAFIAWGSELGVLLEGIVLWNKIKKRARLLWL